MTEGRSRGGWRGGSSGWLLLVALILAGSAGPMACGGSSGDAAGQESGERTARAGDGPADAGAGRGAVAVDPATGQIVRRETIRVGGVPLEVEIADTPELRGRGLMHRESLPDDYGMLFVYAEPGILSFWMRNTFVRLDIAFIDASGVIVNIEQMEPQTDTQHVAKAPALYALETRQGWFADHGVEAGDRVEF